MSPFLRKSTLSLLTIALFSSYAFYQSTQNKSDTPITLLPNDLTHAAQPQTPIPQSSQTDFKREDFDDDDDDDDRGSTIRAVPQTRLVAPPTHATGTFKDGNYTGTSEDVFYGFVQVQAIISGGKLTDVKILTYPDDRPTSRQINSQALPILVEEAVVAQSANVDGISGATDSYVGFVKSLDAALTEASS